MPAATHVGDSIPTGGGQGSGAAVVAGFLGWTLDAFDFFLVVLCLKPIGETFHQTDKAMAGALAITLAFRPVGAFLFGLIADRYGRRLPLMIDLVLYSVVEVASGLAPNFTTFIILRAIFGIAMGGEWGVGASLAMEKVPPKIRGVLSGLLQEGYAAGYLLAAVAYGLVFPHWHSWRPLFFIGGLPALLAVFVRFGVSESEAWREHRAAGWGELGSSIVRHLPIFLYLVALMTMLNLSSHGTQDLYPLFMQRTLKFEPWQVARVTEVSMVGAILGGLTFGMISDRWGRRRAMATAFGLALLAIPLWAMPTHMAMLALGAFCLQFMVQGAWGVVPAHLVELSPAALRGFLPGFSYQMGNLIASEIAILETMGAATYGYPRTLAVSAAVIFVVAAVVVLAGRERRAASFRASGFPVIVPAKESDPA